MPKRIAICQSNYIPWKGYFDMINRVDEFVLYDEVQYTKNDWRNRNKIKTRRGLEWLTIPVEYKFKGVETQKINETKIASLTWAKKHWSAICHNYTKAKYFLQYESRFENLYLGEIVDLKMLSEVNFRLVQEICDILNIKTNILQSRSYELAEDRCERLIGICKQAGADLYLSGPAAKNYLDVNLFSQEGIEIEWMNYEGYPAYGQLYGDFEHGVTILDLIFNCGPDLKKYMKGLE